MWSFYCICLVVKKDLKHGFIRLWGLRIPSLELERMKQCNILSDLFNIYFSIQEDKNGLDTLHTRQACTF